MNFPFLQSTLLAHSGIRHGFFTRRGGVSDGIYASLNCGPGSQDDPEHVEENRRRARTALCESTPPLCTLYQVHGNVCQIVDAPFAAGERPQADALATRTPGIALGILTADCAPVLFVDPKARVIAAAHAGWKGALGGIIASTVEAMETLGASPERILAAIGPCAGWQSYEVDTAFREQFLAHSEEYACYFKDTSAGKSLFNLKGFVGGRLMEAGVTHVNILANDTIREVEDFFSYRRTTHAGEPDYGRQLSAIMLM